MRYACRGYHRPVPSSWLHRMRRVPPAVRWLSLPLGLFACSVALTRPWSGPWQPPADPPRPQDAQARYCRALAGALPDRILGYRRSDPSSSPYVAVWNSPPRTVLRCGVPRPASLSIESNQESIGPNVDGVQWYMEADGHGGRRFTTTLRLAYVEVAVPAGSYPYLTDPLPGISDAVRATVPDLGGRTETAGRAGS